MSAHPIIVGHGTFKVTATPERCVEIIKQVEAIKAPTLKQARAAALRKADKRQYPKFKDGMSTADYVRAYYAANAMACLTADKEFFQPLSTNPQFAQSGEVIEESI